MGPRRPDWSGASAPRRTRRWQRSVPTIGAGQQLLGQIDGGGCLPPVRGRRRCCHAGCDQSRTTGSSCSLPRWRSSTAATSPSSSRVQVGGLGSRQVSSGSMLSDQARPWSMTPSVPATGSSIHIGSRHLPRRGHGGQSDPLRRNTRRLHDHRRRPDGSVCGEPLITAVVTKGTPTSTAAGYTTLTSSQVVNNTLDSLSSATSSLDSSRLLMWIVAGIIISAVLLYVSALQRVRDFAVLKALGRIGIALRKPGDDQGTTSSPYRRMIRGHIVELPGWNLPVNPWPSPWRHI